ncbi:MAG: hypothetical protein KME26_05450 [Oscillatoria princeps RMCB-10]|jgi:glucose-6-phosphate 1-dehydrogenase|nr:hypothetical protein [Oscillatoria princeps RMCB-10]
MVSKFVLYGSTGDLSARQLIPALYQIWRLGKLPPDFQIIALGLDDWSTETYCSHILAAMKQKNSAPQGVEQDWIQFSQNIVYLRLDLEATTNELRSAA